MTLPGYRHTPCDVGLTTLHRPEKTTSPTAPEEHARVLAWATDYTDLLVTIPRNERRTADVSFSFDDPICQWLARDEIDDVTGHQVQVTNAYYVYLFVRWNGYPVIWAPVVDIEARSEQRVFAVSAVDVQRLIDHQIHVGDYAYDHADGVTLGGFGFDKFIEAADVSTEQLDDGTPDHGIEKPGSVGTSTLRVKSSLDDPVWDKIVEAGGYEGAPDFQVEPKEIEDDPYPYYAKLQLYPDGQGNPDAHEYLSFHAKMGLENAEGVDWGAGGKYMTHAVVRNQSNTARVPRANVNARRGTGNYVHVENLASDSEDGTMTAQAERLLKGYSSPLERLAVRLKPTIPDMPETGDRHPSFLHYLDDFDLGDTCMVEERDAYYHKRAVGQINEVRLRQGSGNEVHLIRQELDVIPSIAGVLDLDDEQV